MEKITLEFEGEKISGILIKEDKFFITLKQNSGYNMNFEKKNIKIIKKEKIDVKSKNISKISKDTKLPKITILHTGGTIASKVDYETGAVTSKFSVDELLALFPELNKVANLDAKMISNLTSEDMNFKHYNLLLNEILNESKTDTKGIIITHGTDTMHYTAPALQYAIENLNIPIILVGAQRSSDRASSDAYTNMNAAIDFIILNSKKEKNYRRVGLCMHNTSSDDNTFSIIDSINSKKMHSSRRDAFKQINYTPYAIMQNRKLEVLRKDLETNKLNSKLGINNYDEKLKIGFFKAHPNLFHDEIDILKLYDGVVIEGTGLGHLAVTKFDKHTDENPKTLDSIKKLIKKTKLVMGVQTVLGDTNMNVYSSGINLQKSGILGQNMNLITETLFIRLAYCLSKTNNEKEFNLLWSSNLEGFRFRSQFIDDE